MATNKFLPWDTSGSNILTDEQYQSSLTRDSGVTTGIADSKLHNKIFRQASVMAAALGEFIKNEGYDATDESVTSLEYSLGLAINSFVDTSMEVGIKNKQNKPTYYTDKKILAVNWSGKTNDTFENLFPFESFDIELMISPNATQAEAEAYAEAMLTGSANSNVITALGDIPNIDIPVHVLAFSKTS